MRSVSKYRKDYCLTYKEVEQLTRASHRLADKKSGVILARKVWKRIGEKLDFHYETVGKPLDTRHEGDPRWFSAIPKDTELTDEELKEAGVTLKNLEDQ